MYKELIRNRIREKFKTIENFSKVVDIPRTTINVILKRGVGSSNYDMVMRIFKTLDICSIENALIVNDEQLGSLLKKYTLLDEYGKHTVCAVAETEYRRMLEAQ